MQSGDIFIAAKHCAKSGLHASAPLKASLHGTCLNHPVIHPQPLDSTRLKDQPRGIGLSPSSEICPTRPTVPEGAISQPVSLTYSSVVKSKGPNNPAIKNEVKRPVPCQASVPDQEEQGWQDVRYGKRKKSTTYSKEVCVRLAPGDTPSERNATQAQRSVPFKRNLTTETRRPSADKSLIKKPPSLKSLASPKKGKRPPVVTKCISSGRPPVDFVANLKPEHLEIWGEVLDFARQRGPVKREKFIKVLEATGFSLRNQKGAQASYKPPANCENPHALSIHLPHGPNFEDIKLKNMAGTIKKQYPVMVSELHQHYMEL
ncbi:hypothetical protein B0J17DRAFT_678339 [Rhizoctonia solani]|nr:hypothetical protein B0J17DRAFT_678339 [Rhizoctonia solani]